LLDSLLQEIFIVETKMASTEDVRDIMGLPVQDNTITKDSILGTDRRKSIKKNAGASFSRPEGMHRELYNLLYSENKELPCPIIPTDSNKDQGYKQIRAKLGMRKVRAWKWMPFSNPARKDGLVLNHWRRVTEEGKDYPFARFNKICEVANYTEVEYNRHLTDPGWSRQETDHLMDLATRFDLRFIIMADRWDSNTYTARTVEDLKERYYNIVDKLERVHGGATGAQEQKKTFVYDADHERRRKEQLRRLYNRTQEQLEEEEMLKTELRKIEARKKEREKKTADLQKMIAQADASQNENKKINKKQKIVVGRVNRQESTQPDTGTGIRWAEVKSSGVSMRSARMKLPTSVGMKKIKGY